MSETINCSLTKLNSKKKIWSIFKIPLCAREDDYVFSVNYKLGYLPKGQVSKHKPSKKERVESYLTIEKTKGTILDKKPEGKSRIITRFVDGSDWLKNAQRKFHKAIIKGLKDIPYLQSTLKNTSYATNGNKHSGKPRFFYTIDLKNFFGQIEIDRVKRSLQDALAIDGDVATFYSKMLTSPNDDDPPKLVLGQGLPSSPIVSYICNMSLFDYIYKIATENNITFTIYVDDITFSSEEEIPQSFINKIMGIIKGNKLVVNKAKIHRPKKETIKKVTGVCIIYGGKPSISRKKHEELFSLYEVIVSIINQPEMTIDDFFKMYNYFLKFSGNFIHLCSVQYHSDLSPEGKQFTHAKYAELYRKILPFFGIGTKKNDKLKAYSVDNISKDDYEIFEKQFKAFISKKEKLVNSFKPVRKKNSVLRVIENQ